MEASDTLHNVWIGCAKDAAGSLLMDVAEFHEKFSAAESWDEALAMVCSELHQYCKDCRLDASAVDKLSLTTLHVKSVTFDFPMD